MSLYSTKPQPLLPPTTFLLQPDGHGLEKKQAENNAENDDGGSRGNGEGEEGDGSPSAYLNLNQNEEVIHYCIYVSSSNWVNCRK